MLPTRVDEEIICFADCFFSKSRGAVEKSKEEIIKQLAVDGKRQIQQFEEWCKTFKVFA